jgi:hypothetical protein
MKEFLRKYENRIHGVLSCFDRMLFHGYLPIVSGWKMAEFLYGLNVNFSNLKLRISPNAGTVLAVNPAALFDTRDQEFLPPAYPY